MRYIMSALELLLRGECRSLSVKHQVHDRFNEAVDAENQRMAWGIAGVHSWYKNARGRVSQNWPFTLLEYWRRTRTLDPQEYELDA